MKFQKLRSGLSLVLIPIPGKSTSKTIFDTKGHFQDQSAVIKHRLSDVSANQISIANARMQQSITSRMQDIDERYRTDHGDPRH